MRKVPEVLEYSILASSGVVELCELIVLLKLA